MIVDTSAVVAILHGEPEGITLREQLRADPAPKISAGTLLESSIVLDARDPAGTSRRLDELIKILRIDVVPVDAEHVQVARAAYRDFGRGSGHPAQLNFGDCFAYALTSILGEPLLCVGDGFKRTGIRSAGSASP